MTTTGLPPRLVRARELRDALADERGIWFAPVRHHSPACARAVLAMISETVPAAVLVEGPSEYDRLLPALTDPQTRPPVAVLSLRSTGDGPVSAFYPLADFSPEWVALREAARRGASVAFIDRPWTGSDDTDRASGLRSERYYAESRALTALARAEHCRDHDELWEHLFELRSTSASPGDGWRRLFDDVFVWSATARFDYEPEVLLTEGSTPREAVMVGHVEQWRERVEGPLVVLTGAFHTLALVEALASRLLGVPVPDADVLPPVADETSDEPAWLIRYDLTRLNALTGYGAGIRAPGFYQRQWDTTGQTPVEPDASGPDKTDVALECLTDIAQATNDAGTSDRLSVASVIEAGLQAHRLADLRGHPRPGRTDLLDACLSCFADGDMPPAVRDAIGEVFGGSRLGQVPRGTAAPPIVDEARDTARRLHMNVADSTRRTTTLDVRRSASARRRSRFLWLMSYLGTDFASRTAGPDYVAGRDLHRVREQWTYAWTPMVEARLIELVTHGATLAEAARHRLRDSEPSEDERSSAAVAATIAQAALVGLSDEVARLERRLDRMVEQDSDLGSVLGTASRLLGLWRSRDLLDLGHDDPAQPDRLRALVGRALPQLAYLLGESATVAANDEPRVVEAVVAAHDLTRQLADDPSADVVHDAFARLRTRGDTAPGVRGAVLALATTTGGVTDDDLAATVRTVFAVGADPAYAMRFLDGLMQAAPDLFLHVPELFDAVDEAIAALGPTAFLDFLPDLRRSFTRLRPFETARVAERVAAKTGVASVAVTVAATSDDLRTGVQVERTLLATLVDDGLTAWVAEP